MSDIVEQVVAQPQTASRSPATKPSDVEQEKAVLKISDLPAPDTIIDYADAGFCPLFAHYLPEGCDISHAATEAGFECRFLSMDDDLPDDHPVYVDYFEYGSAKACREWQPTQQGDGWKLVGQWDTEDGPCALFVRPLPKSEGLNAGPPSSEAASTPLPSPPVKT